MYRMKYNARRYEMQKTKALFTSSNSQFLIGQSVKTLFLEAKSTLFKQVIAKLIEEGIPRQNILYLNFELHDLCYIQTNETLIQIVEQYFEELQPEGKVYLFFDEIQEVAHWEKAVNSYLANDKLYCEIFLTGSNAKLLSTELSTYVTGRYIEIPVYPFSYHEFIGLQKLTQSKESLIRYLQGSGMPESFSLQNEAQKTSYFMSLKESILMNDIVKRFNIKNPKLLELLLDFMIDNIGKLFSINAIVKKLSAIGLNENVVTVGNYIYFLELTYLIHSVHRYDLKGKKILEGERKYYLNDLGFSNYLHSTFDEGITRKLENYIFQELLHAGCKIYVGYIFNVEIDFVAQMQNKIYYIQVTYLLHSPEVIEREYGNLEKIKDNWPKIVVSLDEVTFPDKNGIQHVPAWKFSAYIQQLLQQTKLLQ
jgi:predicted AAA+ superfamily ATPase